METLYPIFYGTRLVTLDVIRATFAPNAHPEAYRRLENFLYHNGGKFGVGSGYRAPGVQPDGTPGFAPPGMSFHEGQFFPSGRYYAAWDLVVVNPGHVHRAPRWEEVPIEGQQLSFNYGMHMNVAKPPEPWHMQPSELDGWRSWVNAGRPDLQFNRPIISVTPRPQPPQPPIPPTQPVTKEITVEFTSRVLTQGSTGSDVKFYQRLLNDLAGQGLILDGYYGPTTTQAVRNWQSFFGLEADGILGGKTQRSIIEVALQA